MPWGPWTAYDAATDAPPPLGAVVEVVCSQFGMEMEPHVGRVTVLGLTLGSWTMTGDMGPYQRVVRYRVMMPDAESRPALVEYEHA